MAKTSTNQRKGGASTFISRSRSIGAAQKANWHDVEGAGKSHVKRPFFDLTQDEADAIAQRVGLHVETVLKQAS